MCPCSVFNIPVFLYVLAEWRAGERWWHWRTYWNCGIVVSPGLKLGLFSARPPRLCKTSSCQVSSSVDCTLESGTFYIKRRFDSIRSNIPDRFIVTSCSCWYKLQEAMSTNFCVFFCRGADKSLARPTSQCILFDSENISFDASFVIYINSTNIPPIMIINRICEHQNLLSL